MHHRKNDTQSFLKNKKIIIIIKKILCQLCYAKEQYTNIKTILNDKFKLNKKKI